jgi:ribosome-binding protein aMBF1 (putative translation factor)
MKNKVITLQEDLNTRLKNPNFKKAWHESETEYRLACQLIEKRLEQKLSQRQLAKKLNTSQAVISRIESMNANPSLNLLKRIASALNSKLNISLR